MRNVKEVLNGKEKYYDTLAIYVYSKTDEDWHNILSFETPIDIELPIDIQHEEVEKWIGDFGEIAIYLKRKFNEIPYLYKEN